jgi:hypothetical protein
MRLPVPDLIVAANEPYNVAAADKLNSADQVGRLEAPFCQILGDQVNSDALLECARQVFRESRVCRQAPNFNPCASCALTP